MKNGVLSKIKLDKEDKIAFLIIALYFILSSILVQTIKNIGLWDPVDYLSYINLFSGYQSLPGMSVHSQLYSFFLSLFYRFIPSLAMLRIINIGFICIALSGVYLTAKQMKIDSILALLITITSPILILQTWNITPLVGSLPFFVFGIYFLILNLKNGSSKHIFISAICFGFAGAFRYTTIVLVVPIILFTILHSKRKDFLTFFLGLTIPLFIKGVIEFLLFGFPFEHIFQYFYVYILYSDFGGERTLNPAYYYFKQMFVFVSPIYFLSIFSLKGKISREEKLLWFMLTFSLIVFALMPIKRVRVLITVLPVIILLVFSGLNKLNISKKQLYPSVVILIIINIITIPIHVTHAINNTPPGFDTEVISEIIEYSKSFGFTTIVLDGNSYPVSTYPLKDQQYMWNHDYEKIINNEKYFDSDISKEFNKVDFKISLRSNQRYDGLNIDISLKRKPFSSMYDLKKLENPVYISYFMQGDYMNETMYGLSLKKCWQGQEDLICAYAN